MQTLPGNVYGIHTMDRYGLRERDVHRERETTHSGINFKDNHIYFEWIFHFII